MIPYPISPENMNTVTRVLNYRLCDTRIIVKNTFGVISVDKTSTPSIRKG
jgi:hypothetical protein